MFGKDKSYRAELRADLAREKKERKMQSEEFETRMDKLEEDNDKWKIKYFDLMFAIKTYRLKVVQIAVEHNLPADVIKAISEDTDLDKIFAEIRES